MVQKRGRKSAEDLAVAVIEEGAVQRVQRPDAPLDLTPEEAEVWNMTVDAMPADWFRAETFPLLCQWCRQTIAARRVAQLLDNAMSREEIDQGEVKELIGMQSQVSGSLKALAASMRISQQSSYTAQAAGTSKKNRPTTKRLWD